MRRFSLLFILVLFRAFPCNAQNTTNPASTLFLRHEPIDITLIFDWKQLIKDKHKEAYQPAEFQCYLEDSTYLESTIKLRPRGFFRRNYCQMPPLKLKFEDCDNPDLQKWDEQKMVNYCKKGFAYQQYIFSEYLCYRIFNLLTDNSFRVRLAKLTFKDSEGKKKIEESWGFLIEDVDVLARRLSGKEYEDVQVFTEQTEREQMTLVSVFEYFMGNTDWAVPVNHNIKLVKLDDPAKPRPLAIPYDFDYSGFVGATYAIPPEQLPIENVRERLFRGYCRSEAEFESVFDLFREKRPEITRLIENFEYLDKRVRKRLLGYTEEFYEVINNPRNVRWEFMEQCRDN